MDAVFVCPASHRRFLDIVLREALKKIAHDVAFRAEPDEVIAHLAPIEDALVDVGETAKTLMVVANVETARPIVVDLHKIHGIPAHAHP